MATVLMRTALRARPGLAAPGLRGAFGGTRLPAPLLAAAPRTKPWKQALPAIGMRALSFDSEERRRQEAEREREEAERRAKRGSMVSRAASVAGPGLLLLWGKTKWMLAALKFTKFMPALSMLASTGAYAFFYGWPFAVGMVSLIAVHEAGHLAVLKYYGIPAGPMVFIPFMGAAVEMKDRPKDVKEEAVVAFGGPILGGAAAVATSMAGVAAGSPMLVALADFGIMINLFNLMPIGSLDGGRIGGAVSPWFLAAGLAGGVGLAYQGVVSNPIFYLILLSGGFSTYDRFFGSGTHDSYYRIPGAQRAALGGGYLLLIAALVAAMAYNQSHKKSVRQLRQEGGVQSDGMAARLEQFADDWADEEVEQREADFVKRHFD